MYLHFCYTLYIYVCFIVYPINITLYLASLFFFHLFMIEFIVLFTFFITFFLLKKRLHSFICFQIIYEDLWKTQESLPNFLQNDFPHQLCTSTVQKFLQQCWTWPSSGQIAAKLSQIASRPTGP